MPTFLLPYVLLLKIGAVIAMALGIVYGVHKYNDSLREDGRQEMRLEYQKKLLQADKDKVKAEKGFSDRIGEANANYAKRQVVLNANIATSDLANRGLLDDLTRLRLSMSSDTPAAITARADTLADVLGRCSTAYQGLAGTCDRIANDLKRTLESWPRTGEVK